MKKFFRRIVQFIKTMFTNVDEWIHENVQPSIETIQRLKALFDSPVIDAFTALIPGDADDRVKEWVRSNLDKAIFAVSPLPDIINEPDASLKIVKLIEWLKTLSPSLQKGALMRLASEMAKAANDGKENVKGHAVDLLTQMQYSKLTEGVSHTDLEPNHCKTCGNPQS
jgi:hypothetical protein